MIKSIYIDWNIFQDIIQSRRTEGLKENINAAARAGYIIVYSCAHMRDLSKCSNPEYIKKDLAELSRITNNWCCVLQGADDSISHIQEPPENIFSEVNNLNEKNIQNKVVRFKFEPYEVDISKISESNILFPYLVTRNNTMSAEIMETFIGDISDEILSNHETQKKFRKSLQEIFGLKKPALNNLLEMPIYKYLLATREDIGNHLIEIMESFLSLSGKSFGRIPIGEKITTTYNVLDFFPAFSEKLDRRNTQRNIATDAEHVFMASGSKYLICGDGKMVTKAKLVYEICKIETQVYNPDDFQRKFTFI